MNDLALSIQGLSISFPGMPRKAVDDISLSVRAGEIVGLIGESGSGKSLIGFAAGRSEPLKANLEATELTTAGFDMLRTPTESKRALLGRQLTYIFQEPMSAFSPTRTLGKQVVDTLRIAADLSKREAALRAPEILAAVGIEDPEQALKRRPWELSGGMLQRALIALAFEGKPSLVIADEVTTAIDETMKDLVLELIKARAQQTGAAVLFISHDLECVANVAERAVVMYRGRIVEKVAATGNLSSAFHPYSEMLLGATPKRESPRIPLKTAEGAGFAPNDAGCCYRNRCSEAAEECAAPQSMSRVSDNHAVACWRRSP